MNPHWDHKKFEKKIYTLWEKAGAFKAKPTKNKKPFTIIMPPPNANDNLHIGHGRFITIEDVLTRYHRMKGEEALWLPGADHAGIETQFVFEKKLNSEGKSRFDYDQNTLYKMIWDYVQKNKSNMENQLKVLGSSCDWSRNTFTLDPKIIKVVYKIFKKLYDDGLIYRGIRIVNFCPRCGTAYSQLEVDTKEQDDELYFLDYETLQIATTRPETIFADVAIAVNPKDKRYQNLIGKSATVPLIKRRVTIIADEKVDLEFGTGALKITPGHDALDYEIGQKNKLETIVVIDKSGRMINTPENFLGLKVNAARTLAVEELKKEGKLVKTEKIHHVIGTCYKDKGQIEPLPQEQWFINITPLAQKAIKAIKEKKVTFVSKRYEKIALHWLTNLNDWNISRQIVWGIRIPAWHCKDCNGWTITQGETPEKCSKCSSNNLVQDSDTFDTWFSSGMWPFATLQKKEDFDYFYPTSVMETAYDIIPFWVIRMIMLGLYATGEVPFKKVLIHGLVRDKEGQKISKSKGNVINPLDMVEKYGTDALRIGLLWGTLVENDIALSEDNIRGQRNFSNKIWNIARFVENNKPSSKNSSLKSDNKDDKWILGEIAKTTKEVTLALEEYRLNQAAEKLYEFIWHKFADIYIEKTKEREEGKTKVRESAKPILWKVLKDSLVLLHPFMPFVTEAIYQTLYSKGKSDLLISSSWPK